MEKLRALGRYFTVGEWLLWVMAALSEVRYISVAVCFAAFLVNDLYGFLSWRKMGKRQGLGR